MKSLLIVNLAVLCTCSAVLAQPTSSAPKELAATKAQGFVFHDANGNGRRESTEAGIAGVRVSNGRDIVTTDQVGHYELSVSDDTILFVIKPRGWISPLNHDNLPQFYYIHKPAGSPASFKYPGVAPTGPLPDSVDFPLTPHDEPEKFKRLLFGDPQPRNLTEVEYIAHDVIEQIVADKAHGAAFGVTLGDIAFDDLTTLEPLNQAIALIGIPWYNVIGNHDLNYDAVDDRQSDETFERIYGPSYYAFDHGPAHFLVLDDVAWVGAHDGQKAHYHAGLGPNQLEFIRRDLAGIPADQLVVLMMHIPLTEVDDRAELYRLIEQRPATVSISAHTHYMEHRLIGQEDGWQGPERHHHIVNVTVCGSWWRGQPDERGIPHATMSDGGPNGYSIMEFDGQKYSLEFRAAGRPASYQMNIYAPELVSPANLATTVVLANVFAASESTECQMRVGESKWMPMERVTLSDPAYLAEKAREDALNRTWTELPNPHPTPHFFRAMLPTQLPVGTHQIEIVARDPRGKEVTDHRIIRVGSQ
ncbi:MAG: calcineurin-like phosphoesterase family protein [Pirellulaceae bacterium]